MESLYDDKNVYYLIAYKDPTKSLARFPWVKQAEGCMIACNLNEPGDTSPGRKYTETAGETIDMWHAKYVRSLPMGVLDDQYVDNNTAPQGKCRLGPSERYRKRRIQEY